MASFTQQADTAPKPVTDAKVQGALFGDDGKNKGGRPPGSGTGTRLKPDTVKAMAVMQSLYDNLGLLVGLTSEDDNAVPIFTQRTDALNLRNRGYFEADPKLASRIAKLGDGGGTLAFAVANVTVLSPFVIPMAMQLGSLIRMGWAMFAPRAEAPEATPQAPGQPDPAATEPDDSWLRDLNKH